LIKIRQWRIVCEMRFIETPIFMREIDRLLSDEKQRELQNTLLENPEIGTIMVGTRGARKMRFGQAHKGKSGGLRVIYTIVHDSIWLFLVYPKKETSDLSSAAKKALGQLIERLKHAAQKEN
jgi:mRNA-degrading endonuclease RelE of RelBE toxin-antitoxin system